MLRIFKGALLAVATVSCAHSIGRSVSSVVTPNAPVPYRGLETIAIDQWTLGFFGAPAKLRVSAAKVKSQVVDTVDQSATADALFTQLTTELKLNQNYGSYEAYKALADGLLDAGKTLRKRTDLNQAKQIHALLQVLVEETLYVANLKFENQFTAREPYFISTFNYADSTVCQSKGKIRLGKLVGTPVCSGDVLITKGTAGSSSFLARFADYPANFSHALVAYVAPDTKKVSLFESLLEDGAKLRDPAKDYEGDTPIRKLWYYRYNLPDRRKVVSQVIEATDEAFRNFNQLAGGDAFKSPAFGYDFNMDASSPKKDEALFCSEVPIYIYSSVAHLGESAQPYPAKYWSTLSGATRDFFTKFLWVSEPTIPAPADIEQNPAFDITAIVIAPKTLDLDRIDNALIDIMITRLNDNSPKLAGFFDRIDALGDHKVTARDIEWLKIQPWVNDTYRDKLDLNLIPAGMNFKQLIFFGLLNEVVTPQVRAQASLFEADLLAREKRPAGLLELRVAVEKIAIKVLEEMEQKLKNAPQPN